MVFMSKLCNIKAISIELIVRLTTKSSTPYDTGKGEENEEMCIIQFLLNAMGSFVTSTTFSRRP